MLLSFTAFEPFVSAGSLNAHKVYIVPKNRLTSDRSARVGNTKSSPSSSSPFEQSFRVQVGRMWAFLLFQVVTNEFFWFLFNARAVYLIFFLMRQSERKEMKPKQRQAGRQRLVCRFRRDTELKKGE